MVNVSYSDDILNCYATIKDNNIVNIYGKINNINNYKQVLILGANPIDRMTNYSGSGLPFPNTDIAFQNTPNFHNLTSSDFNLDFIYPNSYYSLNSGNTRIPPSILFKMIDLNNEIKQVRVDLPYQDDSLKVKSLFHRENRNGPFYYASKDFKLPITNQEEKMYNLSKFKILYNLA